MHELVHTSKYNKRRRLFFDFLYVTKLDWGVEKELELNKILQISSSTIKHWVPIDHYIFMGSVIRTSVSNHMTIVEV